MQEAGAVRGRADLGAGLLDVAHLVGEDGRGRLGVLDCERAAEAAALGGLGQLEELEAPDRAQEPVRRVADVEHAQRVAGRVVGDAVRERRADVLETEAADQQLAQLEDPRRELLDLALENGVALGERRVVLAHGAHARGGGSHDDLGAGEHAHEPARQRPGLVPVAGVQVQLAAAGLLAPELDLVAEPLEHPHGGRAGLRRDRVGQARDEERDPHRRSIIASRRGRAIRHTWRA